MRSQSSGVQIGGVDDQMVILVLTFAACTVRGRGLAFIMTLLGRI